MFLLRCNCNKLLGHIIIPYRKKLNAINNDVTLTENEKSAKIAQLLDEFHIKSICCRSRMISQLDNFDDLQ